MFAAYFLIEKKRRNRGVLELHAKLSSSVSLRRGSPPGCHRGPGGGRSVRPARHAGQGHIPSRNKDILGVAFAYAQLSSGIKQAANSRGLCKVLGRKWRSKSA